MIEEWPECTDCDNEVNPKRIALGYDVCLDCGEEMAQEEIMRKCSSTAPAYNKGGYMYVTDLGMVKDIGR